MTVKFNIVPKKDPRNLEAPPKYYPTVVSTGRSDLREIAKRIAAMSTVSSVDTMAVLEAFLMVIPRELAEGNIVELGELGSFRLTVLASGEAHPELELLFYKCLLCFFLDYQERSPNNYSNNSYIPRRGTGTIIVSIWWTFYI